MSLLHRSVRRALVLLLAHATVGLSQTIPLVSIEAAMGHGAHSEVIGGTWFRNRRDWSARIGAAIRASPARRVAAVVLADFIAIGGLASANTEECIRDPQGGCRQRVPSTSGWSLGIGGRGGLGKHAVIGAAVGHGWYETPARYARIDVAAKLSSRLAIDAEYRELWRNLDEGRMEWRLAMIGLRISR